MVSTVSSLGKLFSSAVLDRSVHPSILRIKAYFASCSEDLKVNNDCYTSASCSIASFHTQITPKTPVWQKKYLGCVLIQAEMENKSFSSFCKYSVYSADYQRCPRFNRLGWHHLQHLSVVAMCYENANTQTFLNNLHDFVFCNLGGKKDTKVRS